MKGIGTIIDALTIVVGGSVGLMLKREFPTYVKRLILQVLGFAAILLGARSLVDGWFAEEAIGAELNGTFLIVVALLLGFLFGEALRVDRLADKLGGVLRRVDQRSAATQPPAQTGEMLELRTGDRFIDGFSVATVLCALSSMSFSAAMAEGLNGDHKAMLIKAAVDAAVVFLLTTVYGSGACFCALPVVVVEGIVTFIAVNRNEWLTPAYMGHLTVISSVILIGMGINLAFGKRLRVVNLVPAFLVGPLYWWAIKMA